LKVHLGFLGPAILSVVWGFGGVFGAFRGVVDDVVADELGMRAESLSGDSGVRSRPR